MKKSLKLTRFFYRTEEPVIAKAKRILTEEFHYSGVRDVKIVQPHLFVFCFFLEEYWGIAFFNDLAREVNIMASTLFHEKTSVEFVAITKDEKIVVVLYGPNKKKRGFSPRVFLGNMDGKGFEELNPRKITHYKEKKVPFGVYDETGKFIGAYTTPPNIKHIWTEGGIKIRLPKFVDSMGKTDRVFVNGTGTIPVYS